MEIISKTERKRDVINGLTVEGDVYQQTQGDGTDVARVDNGTVRDGEGQWTASFYLQSDGALQVNFAAGATERGAVLTAIEAFVAEAITEVEP